MVNRMKAKGDIEERAVEAIARLHGFSKAGRTKAGYARDAGDIHLMGDRHVRPKVIVQVKDVASPEWRKWLVQLTEQKAEAKVKWGFISWKRRGSGGGRPPIRLGIMELGDMLDLLHEAGYGDHSSASQDETYDRLFGDQAT